MKHLYILATVFMVLLLHNNSKAQLIQTFGFGGANGINETFPPNNQPANGFIGNMKRGSGVAPGSTPANNVFLAIGFTTGSSIDTADYFSFNIRANQGYQLSLDSIVFGQRKSNTGPASYSVRSSRDGFQGDLATGAGANPITWNNQVPLGAGFQSVPASEVLEFRFYGYAATSDAGTWRLDSVRIHGSITQGGGGGPVIKPKLSFSPVSSSFTEISGSQSVTAILSSAPSVGVSARIAVKGGTASEGSDYSALNNVLLNFSTSALQQTALIAFLDDAEQEPSETLTLVLRKQGLASDTAFDIGADSVFTFTIQDNDQVTPPVGGKIGSFNFTGSLGNEASFPADGQPANGFLSNMKRGSGLTSTSGGDAFVASGFTANTSIDTADYFSFSLRAAQGYKLSLDSIVFGQRKSNSGPANYAVRSSRDGYQADLATGISSNPITYNNQVLFGAGFQTAEASETLEIRFYGYASGASTGTWRLDSVRIYGAFSVSTSTKPEVKTPHFEIYPNPGKNTVSLSNLAPGAGPLQISTLQGQQLFRIERPEEGAAIDVSSIPSGIYLFRFPQGGQTLRWVKSELQ